MRLVILSDALAPHTRRWARWFALQGHQVDVISFNAEALEGYAPVRVHKLNQRAGGGHARRAVKMLTTQLKLRRLLRELRPDVVHAHSVGGYAWAARAARFTPLVLTPWGTDLLDDIRNSRANKWFTTDALRHAQLVTTDGFHFVSLLEDLGVESDKIEVLIFGTDLQKFQRRTDPGLKHRLGLGSGPVVISTRTPNPVHDVATFVRAIPMIAMAVPEAHFVVVGDGTELATLQSMASDSGVGDRVTFTGMLEEEELRDYLACSDLYVSTSLADAGLAASTAEAMAMELPVVQTLNSDNEYWTPEGEGGSLFADGDSDQLAAVASRLLTDSEALARMGARNREKVCAEYDTDVQMRKMTELYQAVIDG